MLASATILGALVLAAQAKTNDSAMTDALTSSLGRTEAELKHMLEDIFSRIDADKKGHIVPSDVDRWMKIVLMVAGERHARAEIKILDKDGDGLASWEEIQALAIDPPNDPQQLGQRYLKERMEVADANKDGKLDFKEMTDMLVPGRNKEMTLLETNDIFQLQDTNKDGVIQFSEFEQHEKKHTGGSTEELYAEFSQYDKNHDEVIDRDEVVAAFQEPEPALIKEAMEEIFRGNESVSKAEFLNEWTRFAKSHITDKGQMIVKPREYYLDPPLNFEDVDVFTDDLDLSTHEDGEDVEEDEHDEL